MNVRTQTLPYEHLQETRNWFDDLEIDKVATDASRWKNILPLWDTKGSNLEFDPWWAGGATTVLIIQREVGSPRSSNFVAHVLASSVILKSQLNGWVEDPPSFILFTPSDP
jgi:hypothetical protein